MMNEDFDKYIEVRCEKAKLNNKEYMMLEREEIDCHELQEMSEILCFKEGFKEGMKFYKSMIES